VNVPELNITQGGETTLVTQKDAHNNNVCWALLVAYHRRLNITSALCPVDWTQSGNMMWGKLVLNQGKNLHIAVMHTDFE